MKSQKQVRHYCAPCEDINLTYVYFQTKEGRWKNLAKELDIEVKDVPKYLPKE